MSQSRKGRKYFQQINHTFAVELPYATSAKLEFLDNSDPAKDIVVRKKAREWVNKNKAISKLNTGDIQSSAKASKQISKVAKKEKQVQIVGHARVHAFSSPPISLHQPTSISSFDPLGLYPRVSRKYDHIIEFFIAKCTGQIPGTDDKFFGDPKYTMVLSSDNSIVRNMAKYRICFIVWLYAIVAIRDVITGCVDIEETQWFYHQALRALQEGLKESEMTGEYSEDIINAIGCIMGTASFSGMLKIAVLHRDAMVRLLSLRGNGDILVGLKSLSPWTVRALQWCELLVAMQLIETPCIPYYASTQSTLFPEKMLSEAMRLTERSLDNLPPLSESLRTIICLLHHVGMVHVQAEPGPKMNRDIVQPMYDAGYILLRVLYAQKVGSHEYSDAEILLAEALHLYLWIGTRSASPMTTIGDLLISRLVRALHPLIMNSETEPGLKDVSSSVSSDLELSPNWTAGVFHYPRAMANAITWSLALGTKVTMAHHREHMWFKGHFHSHMQSLGLDTNIHAYVDFLELFPATEGFPFINLRTIHGQYRH